MTLEEFARAHNLPSRWLSLRRECEAIVRDPHFWSQVELRDAARRLASQASDILHRQTAATAPGVSVTDNIVCRDK